MYDLGYRPPRRQEALEGEKRRLTGLDEDGPELEQLRFRVLGEARRLEVHHREGPRPAREGLERVKIDPELFRTPPPRVE